MHNNREQHRKASGRANERDWAAICDDGAWPVVVQELRKGAELVRLNLSTRYSLCDGVETFGPTLSMKRVRELETQGVIKKVGTFQYRLARTEYDRAD